MPVIVHNNFFKLAKSNSKFQGVRFTQFYKLLEIYRCDTVLEIKRLDFRQNRDEYYSPCVPRTIKDQIARSIDKPDRKSTQALTINRLSPTLISLYTWADISP